jgi:hypothetical protein
VKNASARPKKIAVTEEPIDPEKERIDDLMEELFSCVLWEDWRSLTDQQWEVSGNDMVKMKSRLTRNYHESMRRITDAIRHRQKGDMTITPIDDPANHR